MKVETYNFFFHPLHESHSCGAKTAAMITLIALSILSAGIYLAVFAYVSLSGKAVEPVVGAPTVQNVAAASGVAPVYQRKRFNTSALTKHLNDSSGVSKIRKVKAKQADHLAKLEHLSQNGGWRHLQIHTEHHDSGFDWWMFPVDRSSATFGSDYKLNASEIESLKADPEFMTSYRNGVILVAKSWGWDLELNQDVTNKTQKWSGYNVRLGKMLQSLSLFNQSDLSNNLVGMIHAKGIGPSLDLWIQPYLH
jgi:hypothetical protein